MNEVAPRRRRIVAAPPGIVLVGSIALACMGSPANDPAITETGAVEGAAVGRSSTGLEPFEDELPQSTLRSLEAALAVYEEVRQLLFRDRLGGVGLKASQLAATLRAAAHPGDGLSPQTEIVMEETARAADSLAVAPDLARARAAFGEVGRLLMLLVAGQPGLAESRRVFSCPMAQGFDKWMQPGEEIENPFMGQAMPSCGSPADWTVPAAASPDPVETHDEGAHGGSGDGADIAHYTCSMHPSVKQTQPGTCPICSMNLTPVTRQEVETGVIVIDSRRRQTIGVRTAPVTVQPVRVRVRAEGKVTFDESRLTDVTTKFGGWVGELHVDTPGQYVAKGETLFDLYSPELYTAQEELLAAVSSQRAAQATAAPERADYLVEAARKRLRLWDVEAQQIEAIVARGEPMEHLPIVSPVAGYVVEKHLVDGAAVEPGRKLYRLAGLDRVWIEAVVYESQLPLIEVGQEALITLPYLPGQRFQAQVAFVYPYLHAETRSGRLRLQLANPNLALKPDMYVNVDLTIERAESLLVPTSAVLYAGPRRLVFVDLGEGRLRPQEIEIGVKSGDSYEVLKGLVPGDEVVVSGNFLVAAESRLKSATELW